MSYGLSLLGMGFRNEDDDKSDQKIKEERNVFRLHWEVNVFKIDFQGTKGPNMKYCLTSKVITTGITMIYALRFSLLGLVVTICSVDGGTSEIVICLRMKLHTIKFNLASFTFFKLLFYVGNLECA